MDAIAKYLTVYKIVTEAPNLDSELRQLIPDSPFQTRANLCVEKVLDRFGLAVGRFYAMIASNGESDKINLETIAKNIKSALIKRIRNATWLDNVTKEAAIKKLVMMQTSTGYSTFAPDESSPHDIHRYMQGLKTDFGTFYENDKAVNQWIMRIYWNTLNRALSPTEWVGVTSPQVVNAFNLLSKNSIFVSAAFAQKPNYDKDFPDYLNYAGIGQTLGHEYSHGFDDVGSQYDEYGAERDWWSNATKVKYAEKANCFVKQYSNVSVTDKHGKNYFIDGTQTLGESIADHEGLAAAYDAFLTLKDSGKGYNPVLPGLHYFSSDALFFINAARSFCSKTSVDAQKNSIYDEHAPDSIRVNILFRNNADFSKVFKCPIGSKMNPHKAKCRIW